MKFLIDAQLPPVLADRIREWGDDAMHVMALELISGSDAEIADWPVRSDAVIVSKDQDFVEMATRVKDLRVVWLRLGNMPNAQLMARLRDAWAVVRQQLASGRPVVEIR